MRFIKTRLKNGKYYAIGAFMAIMIQGNITYAAFFWDSLFTDVYESITGPVATSLCGISICATGYMIINSEGGGAARRGIQFIFGLCLILLCTQFMEWIRSL